MEKVMLVLLLMFAGYMAKQQTEEELPECSKTKDHHATNHSHNCHTITKPAV